MTEIENKEAFSLASDLDCLTIDLESLSNLLAVYTEFVDKEISYLSYHPEAAEMLVDRSSMGTALLCAIQDKLNAIEDSASIATEKGYKLAGINS